MKMIATICVRCNATAGQRRPNGWHLCGDCDEEHKREEYFGEALEHWAKLFRDGILSDDFAEDIASVLEDKAHNLRGEVRDA
jgi:hypothetical protein